MNKVSDKLIDEMKGNIIMFYGCMEVCSQARTFMLGMFANCQKRERKCEIAKKKNCSSFLPEIWCLIFVKVQLQREKTVIDRPLIIKSVFRKCLHIWIGARACMHVCVPTCVCVCMRTYVCVEKVGVKKNLHKNSGVTEA